MASFRVVVREPGRDVEAFSATRLPYPARGVMKEFRSELAHACRGLVSRADERLHASYTSAEPGHVDLENILTYNLGTGAISAAARHALLLERSFTATANPENAHHYLYRLTPRDSPPSSWSPSDIIGSVHIPECVDAFREPKAPRWWLHARRAGVTVHRAHETVPDRYGMRIAISPPENWRGSLANLLKPLADGLASAMHSHFGPLDPIVERATAVHPELTSTELRRHLTPPATPLGPTRLVVPRGNTLQWLPADDRIVLLDAHLQPDAPPGTVTADLHLVSPAAAELVR